MLSFEKFVDFGSAAPHVYVIYQNISDWLTLLTVDYLIAYKVLLTASHICFHQKSTTLAYVLEVTVIHCPNKLCKSSFIPRCLFCFFFELTVFSITVFAVCSAVTFAFVICSNNKESSFLLSTILNIRYNLTAV